MPTLSLSLLRDYIDNDDDYNNKPLSQSLIPRRRRDSVVIPPRNPAGASPFSASGRDRRRLAISPRARRLPRQSRRGSATIDDNGGRERTPLLEARRGSIRREVVRSPAIIVTHPRDPTSASTGRPPQCCCPLPPLCPALSSSFCPVGVDVGKVLTNAKPAKLVS